MSNQCISVATDLAQKGIGIIQGDCNQYRANWKILPVKGDLYRIASSLNGLCLAIENDVSASLNLVQQICDDNINTRLWRFNLTSKIDLINDATPYKYEVRNGASYMCTDIANKTVLPGAQLTQQICNREKNQRWIATSKVPDTAEKIDLNLLVLTKVSSKIPGMQERTTTLETRQKQRFWSETALPRFFHDYTNGRVKLNVYYYESPYLLTSLVDNTSVTPPDIPEDMDIILNPGWFDGVFINHAAPVQGGLVTFGVNINGFETAFSNVPIDDGSPLFFTYDIAELGATTHEFSHQLEQYLEFVPERRKLTDKCAPINNSMLDCGANEPQGGNYTENTDGLGTWMAFYRDLINGYLWNGTAGFGDPAWSTKFKPRNKNPEFVPGGPLAPFTNQSTCLNLNSFSTKYAADFFITNNFATISNKNKSINATGESFSFDGIDDYLRISNLIGDDFTLSMWIKTSQSFSPESAADGISLVYAGSHDGAGFELRGIKNGFNKNVLKFIVGNYPAIISTSEIANDTWVHIAITRNQISGLTTLYINNKKEATGDTGTQRLNKNPLVKIGSAFQYVKLESNTVVNDHYKGEMSDFCLFDNVISESEIAELAKGRKLQSSSIGQHMFLSDIPMESGTTGWAVITLDKNIVNNPLLINGKIYQKGIGVNAPSKLVYRLGKKASRFISDIGIDDEASIHASSSEFRVYGDNVLLYRSADKIDTDAVENINIDISNVDELALITTTGENKSGYADINDWGDARIILK